jgi:hypothetical protein
MRKNIYEIFINPVLKVLKKKLLTNRFKFILEKIINLVKKDSIQTKVTLTLILFFLYTEVHLESSSVINECMLTDFLVNIRASNSIESRILGVVKFRDVVPCSGEYVYLQ